MNDRTQSDDARLRAEVHRRLTALRVRIRAAEQEYGRAAGSVRLIGVSKRQPVAAIRAAGEAGLEDIGENYVREALDKQAQLAAGALIWHFIGRIQSNKTRDIAAHFDWVHTVDRDRIAHRLAQQRGADRPPLNVCLQVNLDGEANKAGIATSDLPALVETVGRLPQLRLRGLMAIPMIRGSFAAERVSFARLRRAQEQLNAQGAALDTLSMGMSADLEAAIAEGATMVRVGTDLFGPRTAPADGDQTP